MRMKKREVVCKDCGRIWNIAAQQNTAGGYLCPHCTAKRRQEKARKKV